ncbi:MAG: DUF5009 domain-containing protein [Acidobacteria bacterium]|nr:DUF5009 domain-containing protein [Acidobacteriota bacterium]MBI3488888.1 DUF5009 domain-containing protein [Acidobacteriota bacterium]
MAPAAPDRLHSLDVFRGAIVLAMLFVNDLDGVRGVPWWLRHAPIGADYMSFTDLVFPAFLFMVGMAMPFALGRRLEGGAPAGPVWRHVLARTAGLVAIGFVMVNSESAAGERPLLVGLWQLATFACLILLWHRYAAWRVSRPGRVRALRSAGAILLAMLLACHPGRRGIGFAGLAPSWWGIIGLIGWAYLGACLVYIRGRRRMEALLGGMALWLVFILAMKAGALNGWPLWRSPWNPVPAMAPHAALVLAGAALGTFLRGEARPMARVRWTVGFAAALYVASWCLHAAAAWHSVFTLSKILGTPAWCLRSAAYSALLWLGIYLMVDVAGRRKGTGWLGAAGSNALWVYLIVPMAFVAVDLLCLALGPGWAWNHLAPGFPSGALRAAVVAVAFTWLAGVSLRRGFALKL